MNIYGLIGYPLGHSFSRTYFTRKFASENIKDSEYINFPIDSIDKIKQIIDQTPQLMGFNVTIPYKQKIFDYLDAVDQQAECIGAVNCVKIERSAAGVYLKGYNTDVFGFEKSLKTMLNGFRPHSALVLGTGGASKAVCYVLSKMEIDYKLVSRQSGQDRLTYKDITGDLILKNKLIINTTPLGTFPNIYETPELSYSDITSEHYLFDLVYNPSETRFLKYGRFAGATVMNGYAMLVGQAERAWEIFGVDESV